MAAGTIGQSQIANAVRTFIAEAVTLMEHKGGMKPTVDTKTLPRKQGRTWNEPYLPPVTASSLTDAVLFDSPTQISDGKITITPAEVGVQVLWTHRAENTSTLNLASMLGDLCANAIEYKRDCDLLGQIDNFSTALGGSTTTLTVGLIGAAAALVRAGRSGTSRTGARATGNPAPAPYFAVFHEYNRYDLASQLSGLSGSPSQVTTGAAVSNFAGQTLSEFNKEWIENYHVGNVHGVNFFVDNNLTISSGVKGGVYAKKSMIHCQFAGVDSYSVKEIDGRATRVTVTADYGVGERDDAWGVEVLVDATAPAT